MAWLHAWRLCKPHLAAAQPVPPEIGHWLHLKRLQDRPVGQEVLRVQVAVTSAWGEG